MKSELAYNYVSPLGPLPVGWTPRKLKEITTKIGSGATPLGGSRVYKETGIALIRSQNVYDHEFVKDGLAYIDNQAAEKLDHVTVRPGDVLLNITGDSIARSCIVPTDVLPARVNQHVSIIRPGKELDSHFLLAYLTHPRIKGYMLGHDSGGTRKALTKEMIENFIVPLPTIDEQRRIGDILGRLNDKIQLNHVMNQTLEAISQAIFKSWFIDFEPFQKDDFVQNELGAIPKGWKVGKLTECVDVFGGGTPRTSVLEYWNGDIDWVSAGDVSDAHSPFVITSERKITKAGVDNSNAKVLPEFTTVITARGTVGACAMLGREMAMNQTCYGLRGKNGLGPFFTFLLVKSVAAQLRRRTHGTIFDTITTNTLETQDVIIPDMEAASKFERTVAPLFELILCNEFEREYLQETRDGLLLKLLSGGIRVNAG